MYILDSELHVALHDHFNIRTYSYITGLWSCTVSELSVSVQNIPMINI